MKIKSSVKKKNPKKSQSQRKKSRYNVAKRQLFGRFSVNIYTNRVCPVKDVSKNVRVKTCLNRLEAAPTSGTIDHNDDDDDDVAASRGENNRRHVRFRSFINTKGEQIRISIQADKKTAL